MSFSCAYSTIFPRQKEEDRRKVLAEVQNWNFGAIKTGKLRAIKTGHPSAGLCRRGSIDLSGAFHCTPNRDPEFHFSRLFGQCSDVWPDSSPDPSLRESQPSPRRSQQSVTSHSPPRNTPHQAKPPRRRAIPPLLSCDCRLQPSPQNACQKRYFARMRGTTGFVGSGLVSRT